MRTAPSSAERLTRNIALGGTLALALLCLGWELWWAPIGRGTLAIKALPLFVPLLGLWRYRLYTFRWLSLLVWVYVAEGAVRGSSDSGLSAWLGWAELLLAVAIFAACAAHVRQRLAAARKAAL
ncbi:DUF2069 domain-containing protein [Roseateles sp. BYS180W]|uniref:DUF2069 domain-containing protein n=1 Tax=Roseateles rivi TaxID=3299028 RepID=A0ABW7FZM5_9BURK